jgi:Putative Ig domain
MVSGGRPAWPKRSGSGAGDNGSEYFSTAALGVAKGTYRGQIMIQSMLCRGILCAAFLGSILQAGTVTVGQPPLTGTGNCDPFGCASYFGLGTYQQVYASTAFPGPMSIAMLTFYDTQVLNNGNPDQGTYTISLSYTPKSPGMLDLMNPSNNIGSNLQTFFTGTLPAPVTGPDGQRTLVFSGTTFSYNPADGNLLLTMVVSGPLDQSPHLYLDQSASTAATTNAYFGTVNGVPVSGGNDIGGLVTGFTTAELQITGPTSLPMGSVGEPYGPLTFTAGGGIGSYTWSATGLPNGVHFSMGGVLSGTPAAGSQGRYSPQFTVMDSSQSTATVTITLNICAGLEITGPLVLPPAAVGGSYGPVTFTAAGGAGGYTWSATGLPEGLRFSKRGVLSGTPATGSGGAYNPSFMVTDSSGYTAIVTRALVILP